MMRAYSHIAVVLSGIAICLNAGCASEAEFDDTEAATESASEALYVQTNWLWTDKNINVCWLDSDGDSKEHRWVRDAITNSWQANSQLNFQYWGKCKSGLTNSLRIKVEDSRPRSNIGTLTRDASPGIFFNFTFKNWGEGCDAANSSEKWHERCIRTIAVHEFGHAIGMQHEQVRPENQFSTQCSSFDGPEGFESWQWEYDNLVAPLDATKAKTVGSFDVYSAMNYCSPKWENAGELTLLDIQGVQTYYGAREASRKIWSSNTSVQTDFHGGETLTPGQSWSSVSGQFKITLQTDGNLVLKRVVTANVNEVPIWSSGTAGKAVSRAEFQADGHFLIRDTSNTAIWGSGTWGYTGAFMRLANDGNLIIYKPDGDNYVAVWSTGTWQASEFFGAVSIPPGRSLIAGSSLYTQSGAFRLSMQTDGNLVVYSRADTPIWSAGTQNSGAVKATMQTDGNFVLLNAAGQPVWVTLTHNHQASFAVLTESGEFAVHEAAKFEVWSGRHAAAFNPSFTTGRNILQRDGVANAWTDFTEGTTRLSMQTDGHAVLYKDDAALWSTGTYGSDASKMVMQTDGNLVLYSADGVARWASQTDGYRNTYLSLSADGNVSVYRMVVNGLDGSSSDFTVY